MMEENPCSRLEVEDFFRSNKDMLNDVLKDIECNYTIKYAGIKGHKQSDYVCPKTNSFGITKFGDSACNYCKHSAAIENQRNGFKSYCCYPNIPDVLDESLVYRHDSNICDVPKF